MLSSRGSGGMPPQGKFSKIGTMRLNLMALLIEIHSSLSIKIAN